MPPYCTIIFSSFLGEGLYNTCKKQDSIQGSPMFRRRQNQQPVAPVALTPSWIDRAKVSHGGSFHDATVDDVKQVAKNFLFIFVLLPYWLVYFQVTFIFLFSVFNDFYLMVISQMFTSFQAQGLHMNVHLNGSAYPKFEVNIV